jgi:hypothetical protein
MDLFERIDPVEIPDLDTPPFSPELLEESKERVEKAPLDILEGSVTAPVVAAGDVVDMGAMLPPLADERMMMPGAIQYSAIEQLFETLSDQGVSRENAVKLINENTPINLEGSPAEFIGEMAGVTASGVTKAVSGLAKIASKYGDKAGQNLSKIGSELGDMFRTSTPGGDDFDGMAPATVTDTPPSVATQTDQAFDTAPKLPDTSVSPNMIGQETPYGRRAITDYKRRKKYAQNEGKPLTEEELFKQTGVYVGKDGKYRVELPVEEAKLVSFEESAPYTIIDKDGNTVSMMDRLSNTKNFKNLTVLNRLEEGDQVSLNLLMDFPTLFDAYAEEFYDNVNLDFRTPEDIRNIKVTIKPVTDPNYYGGASYYRSSDEIEISSDLLKSPKTFMATLLHEVQHAVQNREGFVSGSNSRFLLAPAAEEISPGVASRIKSASDFDRRLAELKAKKDADYQQAFTTLNKYITDEGLALVDEDIVTVVDDYIEFLVRNLETGSYVELAEGIKAPNPKVYDKLDSYTMFDFIIDDNKLFEDFENFSGLNFRESRDQAELISYDLNRFSKFNQAIRTSSPDVSFERKMFDIFKDVVRNEREQQYLNKVERLANLNYKRSFGEAESRLVEERYGLSKNLQAEGKSREEIRNALAERYPPQNYTIDLLTLMKADVDPIDAQGGLRGMYKEGVMSEIGIDQLEFVDEDFLRLDPKRADKSAAEKPIIQGANETGFSRAVFHSTGDAKNLRVPKMVPETPGADIGFHVGTTGSANDRIMLQSMARQASQTELDQAFAGKSIMPLRLSDDLKPARLIDLNAFKSPQNWVEELSDPFTSNTELGFFNIPIGTEMPSMTLYPNSKFERTVYMSPQAFAEGVNEDVWRSAILTAEKFLSRNVDTTKNIDDRKAWFEAVKKIATDNGYDSFVYKNVKEGKGDDSYMLLDPRQVKSFTAKDFDPENPDITMAEGGIAMRQQMKLFSTGGLEEDGGTTDPVSGNEVPPGSTKKEVRDDIPAQLSEGEFVFPADVVRFIGLEKLMRMRQEAKMGLKLMEEMGQMGNADEATIPDDIPFTVTDLIIVDGPEDVDKGDEKEYNTGGVVFGNDPTTGVTYQAPQFQAGQTQVGMAASPIEMAPIARPEQQATPVYQPPQTLPTASEFVTAPEGQAPQTITIVNKETGEERTITFIPGVTQIPEGFVRKEDYVPKEVVPKTSTTTVGTTTVREESDGDEERRRQEEAMYGPGGGRLGFKDAGKDGKDLIFGVSFDMPEGFMPGALGVMGTAAGLLSGKPLPADVTVNFKRGEIEFSMSGTEYNDLKSAIKEFGSGSEEAKAKLNEYGLEQAVLEKRQRDFMEAQAEKMAKEARESELAKAREIADEKRRQAAIEAALEKQRQEAIAAAERERQYRESQGYQRDDDDDPGGYTVTDSSGQEYRTDSSGTAGAYTGDPVGMEDEYDFNTGGLAGKKKPKTKKKMKRGGLASKK